MKFLVDAQLPTMLCEILQNAGFEAVHVDDLPQGDETPDREIAKYADNYDSIVITKDADFYHGHMLLGQPKKLLLITTGNIRNRQLFDLFRSNFKHLQPLFSSVTMLKCLTNVLLGTRNEVVFSTGDITALEAEIDQLVYQLYGLTEEEINIIEDSVSQ